jgi:peptide/nickel transport system permease protein
VEELQAIREDLGLNKPIHMQYVTFVKKLFNGTLKSYAYKQPVISIIAERFPATLELGLFAIILATIVSIPAGIISAIWQDTAADYTVTTVALLGISTPVFWTALMLMLLLSIQLDALPVSGRGATLWGFSIFTLDGLRHIVIPMIALSSVQMAMNTRLTRSSMLEVLREDYITTARSKGLKENVVILGHAFRNAVLPVMTNIGMMVGTMVAGAVLTETTTAWPGLGRLMISSINRRDFAVIFALTLLISFGYVVSYLIVDILYAYADPRITYD